MSLTDLVKEHEELDAEAIATRSRSASTSTSPRRKPAWAKNHARAGEHVMLTVLDQSWKEHLAHGLPAPGHLPAWLRAEAAEAGIQGSLRAVSDMLENVKREVVTLLARVRIRSDEEVQALEAAERQQAQARLSQSQFQHQDAAVTAPTRKPRRSKPPSRAWPRCSDEPKIGRNDPCPCGGGKKYKHCHGQLS
jgi:preprotein translocase subunit SecA